MADQTARERAILALHELLTQPYGSEVPRSAVAAFVNDLVTATREESWSGAHARATEQAVEQLTNARLAHDEQIAALIRVAQLHGVGQFQDAEALLADLELKRGGTGG